MSRFDFYCGIVGMAFIVIGLGCDDNPGRKTERAVQVRVESGVVVPSTSKPKEEPPPIVRLRFGPLHSYPMKDGQVELIVDEPEWDGYQVRIYGTISNRSATRVHRVSLDYWAECYDKFGNKFNATPETYSGQPFVTNLYPGEKAYPKWRYDRPIPGSLVMYRFGLDGKVGEVQYLWPSDLPITKRPER